MAVTPRKEQFSGCLVGQCLGDALGRPVEGSPPSACERYVEETIAKRRRQDPSGVVFFRLGQYTDDSQLARELLQSYVETGGFDPAAYAGRIARIFAEGRIVGPGRATTEAAWRLIRGVPWEEAGTPPPSAGNGSAMRAGPIGLLFFDDPEGLVRAAQIQGRITHRDRRCSAGAVAIAAAVAFALVEKPLDPDRFLVRLNKLVEPIDPSVAEGLSLLTGWLRLPPGEAASLISRFGIEPGYLDAFEGISPFVTGSVLWSLYSFLRSPEDYLETVSTAIRVGGDVDTTAAMAGAVSGAYLGLEGLPLDWAAALTDRGDWGLEKLVDLAHAAYRIKMEGQAGPSA